jgi:ABC-type dipeptide/oligopeptide/nickel transport system ATPase component
MNLLLDVRDLTITAAGAARPIVERLNFSMLERKTLAVVGESGAGKSMTGLAIMRLLSPPLRIAGGAIVWKGDDLVALPEKRLRRIRGVEIGLIFQEPSAAMNPAVTVGVQIAEVYRVHLGFSRAKAKDAAVAAMRKVHIDEPEKRYHAWPHELSGGMLQRVAIAIAIACGPQLLIADEPTTALDASVQRSVLELLAELQERDGMALLFITHNLGLVAEMADRVLVMRDGRAVEQADVYDLFEQPRADYTRELLAASKSRVGP